MSQSQEHIGIGKAKKRHVSQEVPAVTPNQDVPDRHGTFEVIDASGRLLATFSTRRQAMQYAEEHDADGRHGYAVVCKALTPDVKGEYSYKSRFLPTDTGMVEVREANHTVHPPTEGRHIVLESDLDCDDLLDHDTFEPVEEMLLLADDPRQIETGLRMLGENE